MKTSLSVFLSLLTLITSAVSLAQTRDYRKHEEIIDQILKGTETGEQVSRIAA